MQYHLSSAVDKNFNKGGSQVAAITFSTALDNSGFVKDSAALKKSMERLGADIAKAVAAGAPGAEQITHRKG